MKRDFACWALQSIVGTAGNSSDNKYHIKALKQCFMEPVEQVGHAHAVRHSVVSPEASPDYSLQLSLQFECN